MDTDLSKVYVIATEDGVGFAENNVMEGWVFTRLFTQAAIFATKQLAHEAAARYYKDSDYPVVVTALPCGDTPARSKVLTELSPE